MTGSPQAYRATAALTRRALVAGLAAAPLAACGIRGPNKRPDDSDAAYPRTYPPPDSVVPEGRRGSDTRQRTEGEQDGQ
jgi:predicted small lipoprotein YifL